MAIEKFDISEAIVAGRGPQKDNTKAAQAAVDEFLASGFDACKVDWSGISDNYDLAKRAIAYRINHAKSNGVDGADDLSMRSNRKDGEIYLIHSGRK